ncbi:CvpA family protein, partial [Acinetobacter baumannii]
MNTIDIIILILLLIGGLIGLRQVFIKAFEYLVGWIFALIMG